MIWKLQNLLELKATRLFVTQETIQSSPIVERAQSNDSQWWYLKT